MSGIVRGSGQVRSGQIRSIQLDQSDFKTVFGVLGEGRGGGGEGVQTNRVKASEFAHNESKLQIQFPEDPREVIQSVKQRLARVLVVLFSWWVDRRDEMLCEAVVVVDRCADW